MFYGYNCTQTVRCKRDRTLIVTGNFSYSSTRRRRPIAAHFGLGYGWYVFIDNNISSVVPVSFHVCSINLICHTFSLPQKVTANPIRVHTFRVMNRLIGVSDRAVQQNYSKARKYASQEYAKRKGKWRKFSRSLPYVLSSQRTLQKVLYFCGDQTFHKKYQYIWHWRAQDAPCVIAFSTLTDAYIPSVQ